MEGLPFWGKTGAIETKTKSFFLKAARSFDSLLCDNGFEGYQDDQTTSCRPCRRKGETVEIYVSGAGIFSCMAPAAS